MSAHPFLEGALRRNRLDGAGLYFGRRGHLVSTDAERLAELLHAWDASSPYRRMGILPLVAPGALDHGHARADALLGDRFVDFSVDDDFVIPGMLRTQLPLSTEGKRSRMTDEDRATFVRLSERHAVSHDGLLDGPWTFVLHRAPTFAIGGTPTRVELVAGVGMRPKESKKVEIPDGMSVWKNHQWHVVCRRIAEVRAPTLSIEVDEEELHRALEQTQRVIDEASRSPKWRRMMDDSGWTDIDLEVQLYVRLEDG